MLPLICQCSTGMDRSPGTPWKCLPLAFHGSERERDEHMARFRQCPIGSYPCHNATKSEKVKRENCKHFLVFMTPSFLLHFVTWKSDNSQLWSEKLEISSPPSVLNPPSPLLRHCRPVGCFNPILLFVFFTITDNHNPSHCIVILKIEWKSYCTVTWRGCEFGLRCFKVSATILSSLEHDWRDGFLGPPKLLSKCTDCQWNSIFETGAGGARSKLTLYPWNSIHYWAYCEEPPSWSSWTLYKEKRYGCKG